MSLRRAVGVVGVVLAVAMPGACRSDPGGHRAEPARTPSARGDVAPDPSPGCGAAATDGADGHERVTLDRPGGARWYDRLVPEPASDDPRPLVVDLHGYLSGASVQQQISRMDRLAEQEGFVLATPQGSSDHPYWNAVSHPELPDDVGFVAAVIDDVADHVCVDRRRVYVDGFSNGAFLASQIACRLADRVAAVAMVAGLQRPSDCEPARPVSVLAIHGTADEFVSYDGAPNAALETLEWTDGSRLAFEGLPFAPVEQSAARWASANGCEPEPRSLSEADGVWSSSYEGCDAGAEVVLHTVQGGGHTWPGSEFTQASAPVLGPTTFEIDATRMMWDFFRAHPAG